MSVDIHSEDFDFDEYCKQNGIKLKKNGRVMVMPPSHFTYKNPLFEDEKESIPKKDL